ncbi:MULTISPECIES: M23 family metallopeptidase [Bizionia]|uniref:M23 family metallopeptidase n=1 Tax=Bizionia algoritergicola TaxID=291187 RepID=A0A5D0QTW5_9FLAO|nr:MULTISPECIES: M23 family metallopeptidase [Bizionia]OBX21099.1 peptidase M23 [Bizionia sp. APA-3]TYB72256.1 M23 family metallopeptidase [Bizionia algoritergicola]
MQKFLTFFLLLAFISHAQTPYPTDYFMHPLDVTIIPSGTFGELRSNHFHSGMDIKTQQREGLKVFATADGYVSRIKIAHFGYGKALYITHPNGYTTVYAHLQQLSPTLEAYIKKLQYEQESFEIEIFPKVDELPVLKGDLIAFSGNTGSSGGPHLHYEIRDNAERPINPLLFGVDITDTTKPIITEVYAYPISEDSHINATKERQKLRLINTPNGDYTVENIQAFGKIGFAIEANDRQDLASNKNGVENIQAFYNGNQKFEMDFKRFTFDESRLLNRYIDYGHYSDKKEKLQKLFVESGNNLSMLKNIDDDGYIHVEDSTSSVYKVRVKDFHNNDVWLTINIEGLKATDVKSKEIVETPFHIYSKKANELINKNVSVYFPQDAFFDDFYINFEVNNDTITLHEDTIPLRENFTITYDISSFKNQDSDKLYIARLVGWRKQYTIYSKTYRKENTLTTYNKTLGTYALTVDNVNPTIKPINFTEGKWLSKYRFLKLKIEDEGSGISNYRATINGKWILMEYDYKTNLLVYDFNDNISTETKNNLKVIVTDNVGNNSTFETTFFRK